MSNSTEKVLITAKLNYGKRVIRFEYQTGLPFFDVLSQKLIEENVGFSLCGGQGVCGKCKIKFEGEAPLPVLEERKYLSAKELREGVRLACFTKPVKDSFIELEFLKNSDMPVTFSRTGNDIFSKKAEEIDNSQTYMVFADIGTTTVVMACADMVHGDITDTYTCLNPQEIYGADVISRITRAHKSGVECLQEAVFKALRKGYQKLTEDLPGEKVSNRIYVSANTVMNHFMAGKDAYHLGQAPFRPDFLEQREVCFSGITFILLPSISAFIGGDVTAGLISCGILPDFKRHCPEMFIDLGTNVEMAVCSEKEIVCTSAAAGPAFESRTMMGSDVIHKIAELLKNHGIDDTGYMKEQKETEVLQEDIRNLQKAKGAVRAGIDVLLKEAKLKTSDVKKVYLAGVFGQLLNVEDAATVGLLPKLFSDKIEAAGNAALTGAICFAQMDAAQRQNMEEVLRKKCRTVNLAENSYFSKHYIEYMSFEKIEEK